MMPPTAVVEIPSAVLAVAAVDRFERLLACSTCSHYLMVRGYVIGRELAARCDDAAQIVELLARFIVGVHARHLDGLPILPGTGTGLRTMPASLDAHPPASPNNTTAAEVAENGAHR